MERGIRKGLKRKEIIEKAEAERSTEMFGLLRKHLGEGSKKIRFLYAPLARGNFKKAYVRALLVSWIREEMPLAFAKLKQAR